MATITRRELRRRIGQTLKLRGQRALAADFTAVSGSTTTTVSLPALSGFPNEATYFNGARLSDVSGTGSGETRTVTSFTQSTGTLTHQAFTAAQDSTSQCELWRHGLDADVVNRAINIALDEIDTASPIYTHATSLACESGRYEYPIPSTLEWLHKVQIGRKSPLTGHPTSHRTGSRAFGHAASSARVGSSFTLSQAAWVKYLAVHMGKVGSPTDNVSAVLETDYQGLPTYAPPGSPIYETDFTGINGTAIRTFDDQWFTGAGSQTIQNNKLVNGSIGSLSYATVETGTTDQAVEALITVPAALTAGQDWGFGIIGRAVKGEHTYYELRILWQNNSPEIELFAFAAGLAYKVNGTRNGTDDILMHNSMLADAFVPGDTVMLRLVMNGTSVNGYVFKASYDVPTHDGSITPSTYIGASAPNGWVGVTVSATLHALIAGTRAGVIQDAAGTPYAGIWDSFSVRRSDVGNTSNTVAYTSIPDDPAYVLFELPQAVWCEAGVHHWYVKRSGSVDADNYYVVSEDTEAGYSGGAAEVWNSTRTLANDGSGNPTVSQAASFWTELDSDFCFQVLPDMEGDWVNWPATSWHIERGAVSNLSLVPRPPLATDMGYRAGVYEGAPIRLLGYRDADEPSSDTANIEANPNYVMTIAILYLMAGDVGGPSVDPDDTARELQYWQRKAEIMRKEQPVRARLLPNTVRVRDNY